MISRPLPVFCLLAFVVLVSVWMESRWRIFRSLGAALVSILLAMILSNAGLLSERSSVYDFLMGPGVSAGIALILLGVDLRSIARAGPRMAAAFGLGAAGTMTGVAAASWLLFPWIGQETWKLAGQFTGTYIGGGMNFAALGQALGTSSHLFSAGVAADVALTAFWMAACLLVPVVLGQRRRAAAAPAGAAGASDKTLTLDRSLSTSGRVLKMADLASLAAIALGILLAARWLALMLPELPEVLWLTTLALAVAQLPVLRHLSGAPLVGNYLMLLFLASNGAQSVIANIFRVGPAVFYFALITISLHGLVIFSLGRLFRIDWGTLAVASQANVGGPASALALATARGYGEMLLPGAAVGLLGYAAGNYCGFLVAALIRSILGL